MKRFLLLLLAVVFTACTAPGPTAPSITPAISPSLIPSLAPSAVPSASPASKPSPVPSADAPTNEPTRAPVQSVATVLVPVLEQTIDLGPVDFEQLNSQGNVLKRLDGLFGLAQIDAAHDRVYVFGRGESAQVALSKRGLFRSIDGDATWTSLADREALVLLTRFDQPGAVYRLPLNETLWQRLPIELDVTALAALPDGSLLIGTRDGLMKRYP